MSRCTHPQPVHQTGARPFSNQVHKVTYNNRGKISTYTDPDGRQTTFDYYSNGIDVWKIRQTSPGINQTLAEFGADNSYGRPASYIDSSRRTTTFYDGAALRRVFIAEAAMLVEGMAALCCRGSEVTRQIVAPSITGIPLLTSRRRLQELFG